MTGTALGTEDKKTSLLWPSLVPESHRRRRTGRETHVDATRDSCHLAVCAQNSGCTENAEQPAQGHPETWLRWVCRGQAQAPEVPTLLLVSCACTGSWSVSVSLECEAPGGRDPGHLTLRFGSGWVIHKHWRMGGRE